MELHRLRVERGTVHLRPLQPRDEVAFVRLMDSSAESWAPWTPSPDRPMSSSERFRRERRRAEATARAGTHLRLGGFTPNGTLVGLFALNEIVRGVLESAHASWQVGSEWVGRGLATAGVRALLDLAFTPPPEGVGLHRVQANIMPSNAASLRVAHKVGFREEGLARRYLRIAGAWQDHAVYALTTEEWSPKS